MACQASLQVELNNYLSSGLVQLVIHLIVMKTFCNSLNVAYWKALSLKVPIGTTIFSSFTYRLKSWSLGMCEGPVGEEKPNTSLIMLPYYAKLDVEGT